MNVLTRIQVEAMEPKPLPVTCTGISLKSGVEIFIEVERKKRHVFPQIVFMRDNRMVDFVIPFSLSVPDGLFAETAIAFPVLLATPRLLSHYGDLVDFVAARIIEAEAAVGIRCHHSFLNGNVFIDLAIGESSITEAVQFRELKAFFNQIFLIVL